MNIGVMLRHYEQPGGGVKVYTQNLLKRLLALDQSNHYVLMYHNPQLIGTYAAYPHVEEIALAAPGKFLWDQVAVPWVAWKKHLDIIFNLKFTVPFVTQAKTAFVVHNAEWFVVPDAFLWYDRLYFQTIGPLYYRAADAIVSVSDAAKADSLKGIPVNPNKIVTVYHGFDDTLFRPIQDPERLETIRQKYQLPDPFILWVGQIAPLKNVNRLLRAFAQIKDQFPHKLVITGGQQRWRTSEELAPIQELGLQDRVHFTGWVDDEDLPALYNLADVFAFPSLYEGFGIPLIEAMACGCPTLTSNTGAPPEVVGAAGYTVNPRDVDDIAQGLRAVLGNPQLRAELRAKGLERAKDFSWDKCARQTLDVLEALGQPSRTAHKGPFHHSLRWH